MRALVLQEPGGPFMLEEAPLPQPGPTEVLVRVRAVALVAQGQIRPVITRVCQLKEADEVLRSIERMELAGRACTMLP